MTFTLVLGVWLIASAAVQAPDSVPLTVQIADEGRSVAPDAGLTLQLNRAAPAGGGRLAVLIDDEDWTGLFTVEKQMLRYSGAPIELPAGRSSVVVYLVTAGNVWTPIATLPLTVVSGPRFDRATVEPEVEVSQIGQVFERHEPDAARPARTIFQDVTSHIGLQSEHVRGGFALRTQMNLLATSNPSQALRFGQSPDAAPRLDLSDYAWTISGPRLTASFGNMVVHAERHLGANLATRGMSVTSRTPHGDLTLAVVNGQSIVGFGNFLGVTSSHNRIVAAIGGAELLPTRPNGARVEATLLAGERQAQSGFTQGSVTDVLQSRGGALRFVGSDPSGRLRLDAGFARAWSTHPDDPLLSRGFATVADTPATRGAEYLDGSVDLVRRPAAGDRRPLTVTGSYRFERVAPLFESVGAAQGMRADLLQHVVGASVTAGPVNGQVSRGWAHDNLDAIESLLRTDTGSLTVNLFVPLAPMVHAAASAWWPTVSYALNRTSQVGEGIPPDGGFASVSQVPDQTSTAQTVQVDWTGGRWRTGYSLNRSVQDNRQPGRETSDFITSAHQAMLGVTPARALDITVTLNREQSANVEFGEDSATTRVGTTVNWRLGRHDALDALMNRTLLPDVGAGAGRTTDMSVQLSHTFELAGTRAARPRLQCFGRWTWLSSGSFLPGFAATRRNWAVNLGATLTVF